MEHRTKKRTLKQIPIYNLNYTIYINYAYKIKKQI